MTRADQTDVVADDMRRRCPRCGTVERPYRRRGVVFEQYCCRTCAVHWHAVRLASWDRRISVLTGAASRAWLTRIVMEMVDGAPVVHW